ncbi:hypothetical protein BH09MYX1_BH09MYX1_17150 [soil metagenome]
MTDSRESSDDEELTLPAQLERALLRELALEWRRVNASYFKDSLRAPTIALIPSTALLGRWENATRTLSISRPFVLRGAWGAVVEVIKHEMAHQYVSEVLTLVDETPHGPAFRDVCRRLGIDGAARGVPLSPDAETAAQSAERRAIERIAKLLALAESPNQHEAEAAMAAAQRLMLKHNLERRALGEGVVPFGYRHLGRPSGRVGEAERLLAALLGRHFFVQVIWVPVYRAREGKRGSVLEICGTASNLAMAEYVHAYLLHAAEELWTAHKRTRGVRGNTERRTFLAGVIAGFAEKLTHQEAAHEAEGLVWLKDADLDGYYRRRHPYVRNVRYGGQRRTETFSQGKEAGQSIVLRKPVTAAATTRGNLLGRGR